MDNNYEGRNGTPWYKGEKWSTNKNGDLWSTKKKKKLQIRARAYQGDICRTRK